VSSVVDSAGNTWTQAFRQVGTGLSCSYAIWYCVLTTPLSAGTITTTLSGTATWGADLAYFDSDTGWFPQATVLDKVKSATANNNANWTTGTTAARVQAEEIGVGGCHRINVNGSSSTPAAGWIEESERAVTNVETNNKLVSQWQKFSSIGTDACAGTWGSAEYWVCGVATFKMAVGPAGGTVTRTGSVTNIQNNANSGSQSVTVPADADCAVVAIEGYSSTLNQLATATVTLGGQPMTLKRSDQFGNGNQSAIFTLVAPPTGVQTLAWDTCGTALFADGGQLDVAFYKGVDQSNPVSDAGGNGLASSPAGTHCATALLGAATGDAIVSIAYYYPSSNVTWYNTTKVNDFIYHGSSGSFAETFPTTSQTVELSIDVTGYITMSSIVLRANSGGGAPAPKTDKFFAFI
jgi:hypothetical protein